MELFDLNGLSPDPAPAPIAAGTPLQRYGKKSDL
jgi:hypothetical protein